MSSVSVRVMARFRPMNAKEKEEGVALAASNTFALTFPNSATVAVTSQGTVIPFAFDRVFDPQATQVEIFKAAALQTVQDVLEGYNGTIFAFGQTGSGKTYTMFGPENNTEEEHWGIIPRTTIHIFNAINDSSQDTEYTIKCSFLEIYMEVIKDLLNPNNKNLKIRESKTHGVYVEGLTSEFVGSAQDISDLIALGEQSRAVSRTNMNSRSSRSHSLLVLAIEQKSVEGGIKRGSLNLVDLAGSEKVGKTGAEGQTLEEAKKINQSLSALGNCIHALTESKRDHIPFRDSKLTRLLQESLCGNTKTTLMVTCSPSAIHAEETLSSLKFGARAKTIKNTVKVNLQKSAAELQIIVDRLTKELASVRNYVTTMERIVAYMKSDKYDKEKGIPPELMVTVPPVLEEVKPAPKVDPLRISDGGESSRGASPEFSPRSEDDVNGDIFRSPDAIELEVAIEQLNERHAQALEKLREDLADALQQLEDSAGQIAKLKSGMALVQDRLDYTNTEAKEQAYTAASEIQRLKLELKNKDSSVGGFAVHLSEFALLKRHVSAYLSRRNTALSDTEAGLPAPLKEKTLPSANVPTSLKAKDKPKEVKGKLAEKPKPTPSKAKVAPEALPSVPVVEPPAENTQVTTMLHELSEEERRTLESTHRLRRLLDMRDARLRELLAEVEAYRNEGDASTPVRAVSPASSPNGTGTLVPPRTTKSHHARTLSTPSSLVPPPTSKGSARKSATIVPVVEKKSPPSVRIRRPTTAPSAAQTAAPLPTQALSPPATPQPPSPPTTPTTPPNTSSTTTSEVDSIPQTPPLISIPEPASPVPQALPTSVTSPRSSLKTEDFIKSAHTTIETQRTNIEKLQAALDAERLVHATVTRSLQEELKDLRSQFVQIESEQFTYKHDAQALATTRSQLEADLLRLTESNNSLTRLTDRLQPEKHALEREVASLQERLAACEAMVEQQQRLLANRAGRMARIIKPGEGEAEPKHAYQQKFEFGQFMLKKTDHANKLFAK